MRCAVVTINSGIPEAYENKGWHLAPVRRPPWLTVALAGTLGPKLTAQPLSRAYADLLMAEKQTQTSTWKHLEEKPPLSPAFHWSVRDILAQSTIYRARN